MRIKLLSDFTTQLLAAEMRPAFEIVEAPGFGGYVKEILEPSLPQCDCTVLVLRGKPEIEIPANIIVVMPPHLPEFLDDRMERLSGSPWSLKGLKYIAGQIRTAIFPKKVLALDFDGTLWKGIVSEVGVSGIEPNLALQHHALELKSKGVLLVGISHNHPEDVEPVWSDPRMALRKDDFILAYVDWEPKADSIAKASALLNLRLESFVFVDDRPRERQLMQEAHPEVLTLDPARLEDVVRAFAPHLPSSAADRTAQYRTQLLRYGEYLENLEIKTDIHDIRPGEYERVAELSRRASQFNLTGRRFDADEIRQLASQGGVSFKTLSTSDRYGDLGLVGFAIAMNGRITDFILSCRAMNRRHEYELWQAMGRLPLDFVPTSKNTPAQAFVREVARK